jgi:hypothetical protein
VSSPQELYDRPKNLFVAGFIGSPSMNFLAATVEDGKLRTGLGDLPLSDKLRRAIEGSGAGRDVIIGIRPEDFEDVSLVAPENRPHGVTLRASIDVFESLGADVFVYFTLERSQAAKAAELEELAKDSGRVDTGSSTDTVTARLDPATHVREGQEAELWVDLRPMHVFNPATGENLALGDGADSTVRGGRSAGSAEPGQRGATLAVHSTLGYAGGFLGPLALGAVLDLLGGASVDHVQDRVAEQRELKAPPLHVLMARGVIRKFMREVQSRGRSGD